MIFRLASHSKFLPRTRPIPTDEYLYRSGPRKDVEDRVVKSLHSSLYVVFVLHSPVCKLLIFPKHRTGPSKDFLSAIHFSEGLRSYYEQKDSLNCIGYPTGNRPLVGSRDLT